MGGHKYFSTEKNNLLLEIETEEEYPHWEMPKDSKAGSVFLVFPQTR